MTQEEERDMNEAEERREVAEGKRVVNESDRVLHEEDEVVGRREAEMGRVVAERGRVAAHEEFQSEIEKLQSDPQHYMTPGARKYFRRVTIGYIILALAMSIGVKAISDNVDRKLREDLNKVAETNCIGSIPTLNKFNGLVDIIIESNRGSRTIAQAEGDTARVKLTTANIIKLQDSKLRVPNAKECSAPILK